MDSLTVAFDLKEMKLMVSILDKEVGQLTGTVEKLEDTVDKLKECGEQFGKLADTVDKLNKKLDRLIDKPQSQNGLYSTFENNVDFKATS